MFGKIFSAFSKTSCDTSAQVQYNCLTRSLMVFYLISGVWHFLVLWHEIFKLLVQVLSNTINKTLYAFFYILIPI